MILSQEDVIRSLRLEPLPLEGGFFRRTYEHKHLIDLGKGFEQPLGTAIYFLLTRESFSALHFLKEDEVYHFYLGDPVQLYELTPEGILQETILSSRLDEGHQVQYPVYANRWHGSRLVHGGNWALLGTTMTPGFTWKDFKLGNRKELIASYPEHKQLITELTREQN